MADSNCEQCPDMGKDKLEEIQGTLWAISVVSKRMAIDMEKLRKAKEDEHDEQDE